MPESIVVEHVPVLLKEAIDLLRVDPGGIYVDGTVGMGGHTEEILIRLSGRGRLIALDRDAEALEAVRLRLGERYSNLELHHDNFKNLPLVLTHLGFQKVDGCLLDLGLSSLQLGSPGRGFSFREESPLDMRMDQTQKTTAASLVNELPEERLAEIFKKYGEEPYARRISAAIVARREHSRIMLTTELAELVVSVKGRSRNPRIHPATQVFQALRIEVNQELTGLGDFLDSMIERLNPAGRLVVLSFHSLEDRIVKRAFQRAAGRCICFRPGDLCECPRVAKVQIITPRPITPSQQEKQRNPRARSARLRAVERLDSGSDERF